MNKPELGNRIYKIFMVITVIILLSVLLLFKQFEMENESFYRYMVFVLSFNGVLSTGAIIREFYSLVYDKKKILLVDDNISTEKIISKLIKGTNIKLDYVSLGKEALDKIRGKEKYDLILLDEVMDPLDGVTIMKKFKDIRNFKTNVILLTRNNEYEYNEEYLTYGFSGYLLKPISKDKLFEIIDKYLK